MAGNKASSVGNLLSILWDVICICASTYVGRWAFEELFIYRNGGQELGYLAKQLFEFPVIIHCTFLLGATVCLVSAAIHIVLLLSSRGQLAKRYRLFQNLGALLVLISGVVYLFFFMVLFNRSPS